MHHLFSARKWQIVIIKQRKTLQHLYKTILEACLYHEDTVKQNLSILAQQFEVDKVFEGERDGRELMLIRLNVIGAGDERCTAMISKITMWA